MVLMKERVTISVSSEALEGARSEVEAGAAPNLSAAVERALLEGRRRRALDEALSMWEDEFGAITEEEMEWGRKELERAWKEISSSTPEH